MAAKLIGQDQVEAELLRSAARLVMDCRMPGPGGCGATFSFTPGDCKEFTLTDAELAQGVRWDLDLPREAAQYKVLPVVARVRCPACRQWRDHRIVKMGKAKAAPLPEGA